MPELRSVNSRKRVANPSRSTTAIARAAQVFEKIDHRGHCASMRVQIARVGVGRIVERHRTVRLAVDELMHERLVRGAHLVRSSLGNDHAVGHEIDVIHDFQRLGHVVRDDDGSGAEGIVQAPDQLPDDAQGNGVEAGERLVVHDQHRVERRSRAPAPRAAPCRRRAPTASARGRRAGRRPAVSSAPDRRSTLPADRCARASGKRHCRSRTCR